MARTLARLWCAAVRAWPFLLVAAITFLSVGTISNQFRINATNSRVSDQAESGQRALDRQCRLLPISRKVYAEMVDRGVITVAEYDLVFSTAARACRPRP